MKKSHHGIFSVIVIILVVGIGVSGVYVAAAKHKQASTKAYLETPYENLIELAVANQVALTTTEINGTDYTLAVADDKYEGLRGIAHVNMVDENQGMIYVYNRTDILPHSTVGMEFNLDIVWLNKDGQVVYLETDVEPGTEEVIPDAKAKYVLELAPNSIRNTNLRTGNTIELNI